VQAKNKTRNKIKESRRISASERTHLASVYSIPYLGLKRFVTFSVLLFHFFLHQKKNVFNYFVSFLSLLLVLLALLSAYLRAKVGLPYHQHATAAVIVREDMCLLRFFSAALAEFRL
jgi:hypothetical protein